MHCGPWLELLSFCLLLASSTGLSGSDLEVSPLPPPLMAVDVAYSALIIRHAYCPGSRNSAVAAASRNGTLGMQCEYYTNQI